MNGCRGRAWCAVVLILGWGVYARAEPKAADWTTYRSDKFGYELSYPPAMQLQVYSDGRSAELRDPHTKNPLAQLDVWPADECPRQTPGVTAKGLGIERVISATQADGDDGSSWCGEPFTMQERTSAHGVPIFELVLTCKSERMVAGKTTVRTEGKKSPTFFADVSPPWRKQILAIDPVGIDPRLSPPRQTADLALLRQILDTLKTFPTTKPNTICIEELEAGQTTTSRGRGAPPP